MLNFLRGRSHSPGAPRDVYQRGADLHSRMIEIKRFVEPSDSLPCAGISMSLPVGMCSSLPTF